LAGALPFAPLAKGAVMAAGRYAGPKIAQGLEQHLVNTGGILPMEVWHGSPHRFPPTAKNPLGEFDLSKIGTGEGAQAYGVGAGYLAEAKDVGVEYAKNLANRDIANQGRLNAHANAQRLAAVAGDAKYAADDIRFVLGNDPNHAQKQLLTDTLGFLESGNYAKPLANPGYLYKVDLPDEHIAKMLDWDKPMSQQPHINTEKILQARNAANKKLSQIEFGSPQWDSPIRRQLETYTAIFDKGIEGTGKDYYEALKTLSGFKSDASAILKEKGIPGIRYLDGGSRTGGAGTSNFVVFDPAHMNIIGRE
jgi:hypothetical protein